MIELRLEAEVGVGGDTGVVSVVVRVDWGELTVADRELVETVLDAVGRHHDAAAAAYAAAIMSGGAPLPPREAPPDHSPWIPNQGGTDDGPDVDGIPQPPQPSPELPAAEQDAGAAGAADDAPDTGPEALPAPAAEPPLRAAAGTNGHTVRARTVPCDRCDATFKNSSGLAGHLRMRHGVGRRSSVGDLGVRMLRALHDAGGEIFDPEGKASTRLFELAGIGRSGAAYARTIMVVLDDAGHVDRTLRGHATTRITLTPSGLAIVDSQAAAPDEADDTADEVADATPAPAPVDARSDWATCMDCGAEFPSEDGLSRHRSNRHPIGRHPFDPERARAGAAAALYTDE